MARLAPAQSVGRFRHLFLVACVIPLCLLSNGGIVGSPEANCRGIPELESVAAWDKLKSEAARVADDLRGGSAILCAFVGYPRSGHSLVASIIDAHPQAAISNEYDLIGKLANRSNDPTIRLQADLANILLNSKQCSTHQIQSNYDYTLPGQGIWRTPIQLIGDKKGGHFGRILAEHLGHEADFVQSIVDKYSIATLRLVHVIRNPFDIIATAFGRKWYLRSFFGSRDKSQRHSINMRNFHSVFRDNGPKIDLLDEKDRFRNYKKIIDMSTQFFYRAFAIDSIRDSANPNFKVVDVYIDDLSASVNDTVIDLMEQLGLSVVNEHLAAVSLLVANSPHRPALQLRWPPSLVQCILQCLTQLQWLHNRYSDVAEIRLMEISESQVSKIPKFRGTDCSLHPRHENKLQHWLQNLAKGRH